MSQSHGVGDRVGALRHDISAAELATGLALIAVLGLTLVALQEPLVHDALHNFRHVSGITCH